jgi:demethoxyubiquinone hydroxylase (CLK1/Coq7/Cat5 family)
MDKFQDEIETMRVFDKGLQNEIDKAIARKTSPNSMIACLFGVGAMALGALLKAQEVAGGNNESEEHQIEFHIKKIRELVSRFKNGGK